MADKLWHLTRCDLFERLTEQQIAQIEARCRMRVYPRGTPIYLPADAADGVLLLTEGRVKLCNITEEGKQAILAFVEPGEMFGELAIIEPGVREEYAEAIEKSSLLLLSSDLMQSLMQAHPEVSLGITKLIGLRRRRIERRLKSLLFRSNRQRLVHLLLELADQYGKQSNEGITLGIKLSHQDLAGVIGSTRETVTVVLGDLQNEKLLTIGRRKITLIQMEKLTQIAEGQIPVEDESEFLSPPNAKPPGQSCGKY